MDVDSSPQSATPVYTRFSRVAKRQFVIANFAAANVFALPAAAELNVVEQAAYFHPIAIAGLAVLALASAFFSVAESSFFGLSHAQLREMKDSDDAARRLAASMLNEPGRLLTTILIGSIFANVSIAVALSTRLTGVLQATTAFPAIPSLLLAALITTLLLVYVCILGPRAAAARNPERWAALTAKPLGAFQFLIKPVCSLFLKAGDAISRNTHWTNGGSDTSMDDEQFISLLSRTEAKGVLEEEQGQMIQGILEMGEAKLREILVPRPDVIAISRDATVAEALALFREHEYSRMPVYAVDLDHIVGVLVAKDLLSAAHHGQITAPITPAMRAVRFVPETMTVQAFIKYAQRARTHLAVVVDEYGGTEGIVTLEDAVEEVVGKIHDETEMEEILHRKIGDYTYRIDGNLPLDDLTELIGVPIEDEEHETVAGFVMAQASKILEKGDTISYNGATFLVEAVDGRRVARLRVHVDPATRGLAR